MKKNKVELVRIDRKADGNLLHFDVNDGDVYFRIMQYDNDYSRVKKALDIWS